MSRRNEYTIEAPLASTSTGLTTNSAAIDLKGWDGYAVVARYTAGSPSAKVFVDADVTVATNVISEASHGYSTGLLGALTTTGTLPTGLSATNYYIIATNSNYYQFASSMANASDGVPVNITAAAGGGNHTFTPSSANCAIQLIASLDNSTYVAVSSENVTASTQVLWNVDQPHYQYAKVQFTQIGGQGTLQVDSNKEGT